MLATFLPRDAACGKAQPLDMWDRPRGACLLFFSFRTSLRFGCCVARRGRLRAGEQLMGKGGYATVEFWTAWYAEEEHLEPYDWLVTWEDLGWALEEWLAYDHGARILVVGCGNSPLSSELFARGYRDVVNVDNCAAVIEAQRNRYPMLSWIVGDVRDLPFEDASFDMVIDKGCLDNLYCYVEAQAAVGEFVREMRRLVRSPAGRFVVVRRLPLRARSTLARSLLGLLSRRGGDARLARRGELAVRDRRRA